MGLSTALTKTAPPPPLFEIHKSSDGESSWHMALFAELQPDEKEGYSSPQRQSAAHTEFAMAARHTAPWSLLYGERAMDNCEIGPERCIIS